MAHRDELILVDLQQELVDRLKGFAELTPKDQRQLGILIFNAGAKRKRHKDLEDCASFSYQELTRRFGRGRFAKINGGLRIFETVQTFSIKKRTTRAYALSPKVESIVTGWLKRDLNKTEELIDGAGYAVHTLPAAIAAKTAGNINARSWRTAALRNAVPVNLASLRAFERSLTRMVEKNKAALPSDLWSRGVEVAKLEDWLLETRKLIKLAHTKAGGYGNVPHRYIRADVGGRLFATGVNLQGAPRQVRNAALAGFWDVDISNCHYAILTQMAQRYGKRCIELENYLANKKEIRARIGQRVGISTSQAKDCLLMALYGARFSARPEDAIPSYIGSSRTAKLYADPDFKAITSDISGARTIICNSWPDHSRKRLKNAMGLWISEAEDKAKILSHLLQGVEALALDVAMEKLGADLLLPIHDGFVCRTQLGQETLGDLEAAIRAATGYELKLEQKQIQVDPDLEHTRRPKDNSKTFKPSDLLNPA